MTQDGMFGFVFLDDQPFSAFQQALEQVRDAQRKGIIGQFGYIKTDALMRPQYISGEPPYGHEWYAVVPRNGRDYFHFGLDNMLHPDFPEYLKLFQRFIQSQ